MNNNWEAPDAGKLSPEEAASRQQNNGANLLQAWACERWREEVKNRPLVNVHRRTLDDTWRQVIRFAGGDPDALVGPSHDALIAGAKHHEQN